LPPLPAASSASSSLLCELPSLQPNASTSIAIESQGRTRMLIPS
jgi:hypothetical protein